MCTLYARHGCPRVLCSLQKLLICSLQHCNLNLTLREAIVSQNESQRSIKKIFFVIFSLYLQTTLLPDIKFSQCLKVLFCHCQDRLECVKVEAISFLKSGRHLQKPNLASYAFSAM